VLLQDRSTVAVAVAGNITAGGPFGVPGSPSVKIPRAVACRLHVRQAALYFWHEDGPAPINYDFGSILRFIEEAFLPSNTFINPTYPYADQFVTFGKNDLSDFFGCFTQACQNPFQPITLVNNSQLCNQTQCKSNQCDATCFINYQGLHKDPDTD
jgi:hypothetical protein